ncbi:MAG TPA: biopolymer transporter ExbD, partial [Paludibacteraceae bacterium]|nr:biopolymer transporter ExbD [Paludibacteraceae bacterium]
DKYRGVYGSEMRVQLDDAFADVSQIEDYIVAQRAAMNEYEQSLLTVALRVDEDAKMGIVTDIKQALRRAYALKINYVSRQRDNSQGF